MRLLDRESYRLQARLMPKSGGRLRWFRMAVALLIAAWGVLLFGIEIARSATGIDFPSTLNFPAFFWLMLRGFPYAMFIGIAVLHLYATGTAAKLAGTVFLHRGRVPYDLLSVTPFGTRRFLFQRLLATLFRLLPHSLVIGAAYCGLAVHLGYEQFRNVYLYNALYTGELTVEVWRSHYFPAVESFFITLAVTAVTGTGTAILMAGIGIAASVFSPRSAIPVSLMLRLLVIGGTVLFNAVVFRYRGFSAEPDLLRITLSRATGMFIDGGLSQIAMNLSELMNQSRYNGADSEFWLNSNNGTVVLAYLLMCCALTAFLFGASLWHLRRR